MRWLNVSVEFICPVKSSSKLPDPYASQSSQESEPLPVRAWARNRHRRHAAGQLYYDPRSLYYYYACLNYYYNMHMMNLAHASTTDAPQVPTTTASPPRDHHQKPFYFPYYNPYYHQVPVMPPQSSPSKSNTGTKQKPKCKTPGDVPVTPHVPTPQPPCPPSTTAAPTTVTAAPCPNQERPIGETCLGAVSKYVPYQNLTFRPYISYEAGEPADDQQSQTSQGSTGGAHPRAFPPLKVHGYKPERRFLPGYLPDNYPVWRYYFYYPYSLYLPKGFWSDSNILYWFKKKKNATCLGGYWSWYIYQCRVFNKLVKPHCVQNLYSWNSVFQSPLGLTSCRLEGFYIIADANFIKSENSNL